MRSRRIMPHPNGEIRVSLKRHDGKLIADVTLPANVTGEFEWAGTKRTIRAGDNHLEF